MEAHAQAVASIAAAVRRHFARREPYRIFHGSTNSTRPRTAAGGHTRAVDISALRNVLAVDVARRQALVEPNVPMDRLVAATLAHGLVPPVVMEFPGITAGGGFAGTAGESSSFRYGFFDQTVDRVEMVLANGDVVEARPRGGGGGGAAAAAAEHRADLFHGAAGALGTLGITTLLTLQLVPARRYVKTTYHRRNSVADTIRLLQAEADPRGPNDYVDGILFSKDHGVVITGQMTDEEPPTPAHRQTFSRPSDPWFYLHVQQRTADAAAAAAATAAGSVTEYVPLAEYLFRYDRGGFWVGRSAFAYFPFPFNRATRWFLDDFLHTRMLYKALHASGHSATYVVQDLALPYATAEAFVDYTADVFGIWPLWLCPLRVPDPAAGPTFHPHLRSTTGATNGVSSVSSPASPSASSSATMLNIGLWGPPRSAPGQPALSAEQCIDLNRDLERRLADDLGGMKWLYAHAYYDEDAFWRIYGNRPAYEALREKYHATTLPSVYDKVRVQAAEVLGGAGSGGAPTGLAAQWPFAGFRGLRAAIASKAYLPRTPPWRAYE